MELVEVKFALTTMQLTRAAWNSDSLEELRDHYISLNYVRLLAYAYA